MHYSDEPCLRTLAGMSTTEQVQALDAERQFIAAAAELGSRIARHAAGHDRDGTFVTEAYDEMRASGYLTLAVPTELGGQGATIRQVAMAQRELARHCASTALASTMHHHVVLFTAWRYRRGLPGAEATLAPRRRRRDRAGVDGRGRHDPPAWRGQEGRRRLPGQRPQDLRQPVTHGCGDVDDVPVRRPRRGPDRSQHGGSDGRRGRERARQLGRDGHARHGQSRRRDRRTCSSPRTR